MSNRIVELATQVVNFTEAAEQFEERIAHHQAEASNARSNLEEALKHRDEALQSLVYLRWQDKSIQPNARRIALVNDGEEKEEEEEVKPKPKRKQHNRTHEKQRPSRIREGTQRTREFKYWSGQYVSRARALECGTVETYYNHKGEYRRAIWLTKPEKKKVMEDCLKTYPSHKYKKKKEQNNE
jgi:hypothetical protein